MAKYKMTLFARFFIFLIIVIPIAYIAAAYINGQDGLQQIMSLFKSDQEKTEMTSPPATDTIEQSQSINTDQLIQQKSDSIQLLKEQLEACQNK